MNKLRVYGTNYGGTSRRIVAAKSLKEAAKLINTTYSDIRNFGCETKNPEEVELALRIPGTVWEQEYKIGAKWQQVMSL